MRVAYNLEAGRKFAVEDRVTGMGRTRILIRCPFCAARSWAYVWSLSGGGKRCENSGCGAMFTSLGEALPVVGREPKP